MKVDFPRGNEIIFEPVAHLVYSVASVGLLKRVWTSFSDSNFWNFFRFHASSALIIQYLATDDSKDSTVVIPLLVDFGGHENILPQGEGWLQIYGSRVSKSHLAYTAGKSWIWKCLGISFSDFQFGNFVFIVIYLLHWSSSTGLPWANVVVLWFCLGGTWGWVQYCIFTGNVW